MEKEKQTIMEKLNSIKNGTDIEFSNVRRDDDSAFDGEDTEKEEKKKVKTVENQENEETDEEVEKKPKKKTDDQGDDENVIIAINADGSSISAASIKPKSCFDILTKSQIYDSTTKLNSDLLARTKSNISSIKKSFSKVKQGKSALSTQIHELCKGIETVVNEESKRSRYQDNGMSKAMAMAFEPLTELAFVLTSLAPSKLSADDFSVETRDLLDEVSTNLARVVGAKTYSERIIFLMSLGSQYKTLMQTHPMLKGEPNFINGSACDAFGDNTYEDMWSYFLYDVATDSSIAGATRHRGKVGDNAIQPDVTITKPFFLLFVDDVLIRELRNLNISDNALSVLGNFAMPTDLWNENFNDNTTRWEPENEGSNKSNISTIAGDGKKPFTTEPVLANRRVDFTWSHNGTLSYISKTPTNMQARNRAFINDVSALIELTKQKNIVEISKDLAFFLVLTSWLNATFKFMIDLNSSYMDYVTHGVKLNADRFITPNTSDIVLQALNTFTPDETGFQASSIMDLIERRADILWDEKVASGYRYSAQAYQFLKDEFSSVTYSTNGDDNYYIGDAEVGKNNIIITVLQKLYLPIDVLATPIAVTTQYVSTGVGVQHTIENPYLFGFATANAKFDKNRAVAERGLIANMSLWHIFASMTSSQYNGLIEAFYCQSYQDYNNETKRLGDIFSFIPEQVVGESGKLNFSAIPHLRTFSPLTPAYNRASLLGNKEISVAPINYTDSNGTNVVNTDVWALPLLDEAMSANLATIGSYAGTNIYSGVTLGWIIQALVNNHADFSWIQMGLILSTMKEFVRVAIIVDPILKVTNQTIPGLNFRLGLCDNTNDNYVSLNEGSYTTAANGNITAGTLACELMDFGKLQRNVRKFFNDIVKWERAVIASPIEHLVKTDPKTAVSTADLLRAFRYVKYTFDDNTADVTVLVDNTFAIADKTCPKTIYCNVAEIEGQNRSEITRYNRLIRDDESINITEDYIRDQVTTADYSQEGLLLFDNYHIASSLANAATPLPQYNQANAACLVTQTPLIIPNTNFIGINTGTLNVIEDLIYYTNDDYRKSGFKLHNNNYCYIPTDFYPSQINFTTILPFATKRADDVLDKLDLEDAVNESNNLLMAEVLVNAFHRAGFDAKDKFSTYSFCLAVVGVDPTTKIMDGTDFIRDRDTHHEIKNTLLQGKPGAMRGFGYYTGLDDNNQLLPNTYGKDVFGAQSGITATAQQMRSFKSSYRYPKMGIFPALTSITGIPIFYDYLMDIANHMDVSAKKAKQYFEKFNSIVPEYGYNLYRNASGDSASSLFAIAINGNPNYDGGTEEQLTIAFTSRNILKMLDLFYKDR